VAEVDSTGANGFWPLLRDEARALALAFNSRRTCSGTGKRLHALVSRLHRQTEPMKVPNQAVQPTGASRLVHTQIERHRRLAPVADLCVRLEPGRGPAPSFRKEAGVRGETTSSRK